MKPVVVVGAGLRGLAAAHALHREGVPVVVLEREERIGGRAASLESPGWVADTGRQEFRSTDHALLALLRAHGMGPDCVRPQGLTMVVGTDGAPRAESPTDTSRLVLRRGWNPFLDRAAAELAIWTGHDVAALRWDPVRLHFTLRDGRTGRTLVHPVTSGVLTASAVVLAVPGCEARRLCESSRALAQVAPALGTPRVRQTLTGVFEVPRLGLPWLAIVAGSCQPLARVGLEENKATQRVPSGDRSIVVVVSGRALGSALWSHETRGALARLWAEARLLAPSLPHDFAGAVLTRWETSDAGSAVWDPGELEAQAEPPGLPLAFALAPGSGGTAEEAVAAGFAAAARIRDKRG